MNEILHQAADLKKNEPDSALPQMVYDSLLVNFRSFVKLLVVSDVVSTYSNLINCRASLRKQVKIFLLSFTSQWLTVFIEILNFSVSMMIK